jgi:hypothetical protein
VCSPTNFVVDIFIVNFIIAVVTILSFVATSAIEIVFAFVGEEGEHVRWADPCLVEVG